jgi:hypothetical protein
MDSYELGTLLIDWQGADGFEEFMAGIEIPYISILPVFCAVPLDALHMGFA